LGDLRPNDVKKAKIWEIYRTKTIPKRVIYAPGLWWVGLVWATAATSLHNVSQLNCPWPGCEEELEPLKLDEDPLTFLGILVDIVQEWDRNNVFKETVITRHLPIQGTDIEIAARHGRIELNYGDSARSQNIEKDLNQSLYDWEDVLKIVH
jgi:hypothetical protein